MAKAKVTKLSRIDWKEETVGLWDWEAMKSLVTDEAAGKLLAISAQSVRNARKRFGIASSQARPPKPELRISHPELEWSFVIPGVWDMEAKVARVPDDALAVMMKCTTRRVALRRSIAGVRPYPETT